MLTGQYPQASAAPDMNCAPPEPPYICGKNHASAGTTGSGTVFFSGCTLRCVFCQNFQLSHENYGKTISASRLSDIFLELQEKGAANINLVTGTQFAPSIIRALDLAKPKLQIPVVFNCGGYEKIETIPGSRRLRRYLAPGSQIHGQRSLKKILCRSGLF